LETAGTLPNELRELGYDVINIGGGQRILAQPSSRS
jgi:hypothetical protein